LVVARVVAAGAGAVVLTGAGAALVTLRVVTGATGDDEAGGTVLVDGAAVVLTGAVDGGGAAAVVSGTSTDGDGSGVVAGAGAGVPGSGAAWALETSVSPGSVPPLSAPVSATAARAQANTSIGQSGRRRRV
jgi:hypothetical protein